MDMAGITYSRFDVWLVSLDPVKGSEIKKTRPCIIISPKEINEHMNTVIIAPLTSTIKNFPFRLNCEFQGHKGQIALDHIRSVDKIRLVKKIGIIQDSTTYEVCQLLHDLFEF
jgi:mRNA interferase MazF